MRASPFRWDEPTEFKLLTLLGQGYTQNEVAKRLGCSRTSVKYKARQLGARLTEVPVYPLNSLQNRFLSTANDYAVGVWIERGWLAKPAVSRSSSGVCFRRFTLDQLEQFLEVEAAWVAWQPGDLLLPDRELHRYVRELRASPPWHWMTTEEAARELGYSCTYLLTIIRDLFSETARQQYGGGWWVRSDEVARVKPDLALRRPGVAALAEVKGEGVADYGVRLTESQARWLLEKADTIAAAIRKMVDEAMLERNP